MTTNRLQVRKAEDDIFSEDFTDMITMFMMMLMMVILSEVIKTPGTAQMQAQQYRGLTDPRVLHATPALQWVNLITDPPYTPWITASFVNDGLLVGGVVVENSAFIGINNPDMLHELKCGEPYEVSMAEGRGIELIYYKSTDRATVRVVGKY